MINGVHHITINVKELEKSIHFYGEFLKLHRLEDVDMGDHRLIYFLIGENLRLELIDYMIPGNDFSGGLTDCGMFRHLALLVDDINEIEKCLESYGGEVLQPPRRVEKLKFTGMLALDPNGCELEFIQMD